ncbi:hypothetical protein Tco_0681194 [Tanacetum coccineum]|uniref:Uncharacterized protein n=1 Tax=Tanacetum coccineum TaxID=301880 RepID=A0ABQ4XMW3_9ASTR
MQAYDAISPPQVTIPPPTIVPPSSVLSLPPMFDSRDFFPPKEISPPKELKLPVESPILQLDSSLWIIPRPLGSEPVPEESNELIEWLLKGHLTSVAPPWTQAALRNNWLTVLPLD